MELVYSLAYHLPEIIVENRVGTQLVGAMSDDTTARYPLKVQAIRSKGQQARLYVYFPLPLAAAIGLGAGEEVQWELLNRGELHLVRRKVPPARTRETTQPGP